MPAGDFLVELFDIKKSPAVPSSLLRPSSSFLLIVDCRPSPMSHVDILPFPQLP